MIKKKYNFIETIKLSLLIVCTIALIMLVHRNPISNDTIEQSQQPVNHARDVIKFTDCLRAEWFTGESMLPTIEPNRYVLIDMCFSEEDLKPGDLIAFYSESHFEQPEKILHRITKINYDERWVITKGDNNKFEDDIRDFRYIFGKVIR